MPGTETGAHSLGQQFPRGHAHRQQKCALCCGGDLGQYGLGNVLVLFAEIVDRERGRALAVGNSGGGSVRWHWEMAAARGDHILEQFFETFRDAESFARVGLMGGRGDLRGRGLRAERVLAVACCSLRFVLVAFVCLLSSRDCWAPDGRAPRARCATGNAHGKRRRSANADAPPRPAGARTAPGERLATSSAVVAR